MPKPMIREAQKPKENSFFSNVKDQEKRQPSQSMDKMKLDRLLRKTRSKNYLEALCKLDAGGQVHNHDAVNNIISAIKNEFPEVEIDGVLLGVVSKCYLGNPYEVHTIDMIGSIISHYKNGQILPDGMEKARSIAMNERYDFIEVYVDCFRAVSSNGTVSVIK